MHSFMSVIKSIITMVEKNPAIMMLIGNGDTTRVINSKIRNDTLDYFSLSS